MQAALNLKLIDPTSRARVPGVGNPLSPERTRMLLALRINVLAKGYSGISLENLNKYIAAFNGNLLLFVKLLAVLEVIFDGVFLSVCIQSIAKLYKIVYGRFCFLNP